MKEVWEALIYGTQLHFWNSGSISISISISKILTINDFQITFRFENQQFVYTYTLRIMLRLYSMIKGYTEKHDINISNSTEKISAASVFTSIEHSHDL